MLSATTRFIVSCSESWWKVLLLFLGFGGTLAALQQITGRFPGISGGSVPFDMQNDLTASQIFAQLSTYSDEAFSSYYLFQAVDFAFPLLASLFLAALLAFGLRHTASGWYAIAVGKNLLVLMLLPALFDYLENINFLWVIAAWPDPAEIAAQLGVLAKKAKLACVALANGLTALSLLTAAGRWLGQKAGLISD